jgi:hypothetical protein
MRKLVYLLMLLVVGCGRDLPTAPSLTPTERASTPSSRSDVLRITWEKVAENMANLTLMENPQWALPSDKQDVDWNEAFIYVYRMCGTDGKEEKVAATYSNDKDPVTGKRTVTMPKTATCPGNKIMHRFVMQPKNSREQIEWTFPSPGLVLLDPFSALSFTSAESIEAVSGIKRRHTFVTGQL